MLEEKYKDVLSVLVSEELKSGRVFCFEVSMLSMLPVIKPKDEISVKKISIDSLRCGDIIVFERDREFHAHRFLGKKKYGAQIKLITKGDNSFVIDTPVSEDEFLGRVVSVRKNNKNVNLENKIWKIINVLIGTFSYLEWMVYNALRKFKRSLLSNGSP